MYTTRQWMQFYFYALVSPTLMIVDVVMLRILVKYFRWNEVIKIPPSLYAELESACGICLVGFKEGDECRILGFCNHLFHKTCLDDLERIKTQSLRLRSGGEETLYRRWCPKGCHSYFFDPERPSGQVLIRYRSGLTVTDATNRREGMVVLERERVKTFPSLTIFSGIVSFFMMLTPVIRDNVELGHGCYLLGAALFLNGAMLLVLSFLERGYVAPFVWCRGKNAASCGDHLSKVKIFPDSTSHAGQSEPPQTNGSCV